MFNILYETEEVTLIYKKCNINMHFVKHFDHLKYYSEVAEILPGFCSQMHNIYAA